ncbi:entericidin A/B family lipoprotein [Hyphomonas johnsonii]|jgi:predicted small secreted protein|uniref:Entericidin EcnAB n=1 Tax=Hyphomonas johnsonii MHS-2 TaxID=1280950 RepID=A0A059FTA8_9PROT|nr:entericidin A/B family lipoprotein [Hyphomonas johnsonii]KCZ93904.1 entericidin EcnAB [Hyphomonas johnsonii MHS-2]
MLNMMKIFGVVALVLALSACNTIEGVGQDVEATGDSIEDAANNAK